MSLTRTSSLLQTFPSIQPFNSEIHSWIIRYVILTVLKRINVALRHGNRGSLMSCRVSGIKSCLSTRSSLVWPDVLVYLLLHYWSPLGHGRGIPAQTGEKEGIPCLPTSSVKYVHLLASVFPPCGMTQRAFFIAHDINWCDLQRESI